MKQTFKAVLVFFALLTVAQDVTLAFQTEPTTLIFVRHAERAEDGTRNPPISEEGQKRAVNLYHALSGYDIKAIYSTPYKRTQMTAKPTADSLGLEVQEYGFDGIRELLANLIAEYEGGTVLIVGHSNTTPALTNLVLGEEKFEQLEESAYGDMFIITTSEFGSGEIKQSKF
ncbi:MAG: phosphoglycerate mutase family protein [Balneola sp.]